MFCTACGRQQAGSPAFCRACGARLRRPLGSHVGQQVMDGSVRSAQQSAAIQAVTSIATDINIKKNSLGFMGGKSRIEVGAEYVVFDGLALSPRRRTLLSALKLCFIAFMFVELVVLVASILVLAGLYSPRRGDIDANLPLVLAVALSFVVSALVIWKGLSPVSRKCSRPRRMSISYSRFKSMSVGRSHTMALQLLEQGKTRAITFKADELATVALRLLFSYSPDLHAVAGKVGGTVVSSEGAKAIQLRACRSTYLIMSSGIRMLPDGEQYDRRGLTYLVLQYVFVKCFPSRDTSNAAVGGREVDMVRRLRDECSVAISSIECLVGENAALFQKCAVALGAREVPASAERRTIMRLEILPRLIIDLCYIWSSFPGKYTFAVNVSSDQLEAYGKRFMEDVCSMAICMVDQLVISQSRS